MRLGPSRTKEPVLARYVPQDSLPLQEAPLALQLFVMLANTCLEVAVFNVQPDLTLHPDPRVVPPARLVPFLAVAQRLARRAPLDRHPLPEAPPVLPLYVKLENSSLEATVCRALEEHTLPQDLLRVALVRSVHSQTLELAYALNVHRARYHPLEAPLAPTSFVRPENTFLGIAVRHARLVPTQLLDWLLVFPVLLVPFLFPERVCAPRALLAKLPPPEARRAPT